MSSFSLGSEEIGMTSAQRFQPPAAGLKVQTLTNEHEAEVLDFLSARPRHTVFLAGFIRDNGLVSERNRGSFYACRDKKGRLEGVALIGHATLIEARSDAAFAAFARFAQGCSFAHMILGEQEKVGQFWTHYAKDGRRPRLICRELLLEKRWPVEECEDVPGLRLATLEDITHIMSVNAGMAFQESGVNPQETDPKGFRLRCARRIEQNRIWVWTRSDQLVFKAEVIADTPDCIYLEGVYVKPEDRSKGYGLRCFSQLCRNLLSRTVSICLLVNEQNMVAIEFYQKAGYQLCSYYDTIFLHTKN